MPSLRSLDAHFVKLTGPDGSFRQQEELAGSDGVWFLCPLCFKKNGSEVGTHHVLCWWVGVDPAIGPKPGRWTPQGTGLDDLTFVPSPGRSQSVAITTGCRWHGFVTNGYAD